MVASALDDLVENVAILINGTPKPVLLAGDGNQHLIPVPDILARRTLVAQLLCIGRVEFPSPTPDRSYETLIPHSNSAPSTSRRLNGI